MEQIGSTIRYIRTSKNLKQTTVAGNIPISTYRRIEANTTVCTLSNFFQIISNLHLDVSEFLYIHLDFQLTERQKLLKLFLQIRTTLNKEGFAKFFAACDFYLKNHNDCEMENLKTAMQGLYQFSLTEDREACYEFIRPLWDRLFDREWFYYDALTVSCLLYFIPNSKEIQDNVEKLEITLNRYQELYDTKKSILRVYLNAIYGLKKNGSIFETDVYIDKAIKLSHQLNEHILYYDTLYKKAELEFMKGHYAEGERLAQESFEGLELYEDENKFYLKDNKSDWAKLKKADK